MTQAIHLETRLNQTSIPAFNQVQLVYVLVEMRPGAGVGAVEVPVNFSIVVDRSESMLIPILSDEQFQLLASLGRVQEVMVDGVPVWQFSNVPKEIAASAPSNLDFVKSTLRVVLEQLRPHDRFSLVAFAGKAKTLVSNESGRKKRRLLDGIKRLDGIKLGDDTYMGKGMALGIREAFRSMEAASMVNRMIVLTDGFTMDETECIQQAQQATAQGMSVSTMGLGVEFNDELMIRVADLTGGSAYFIQDPEEIPEAFARELTAVQSVALRNLDLKLRLANGVELRRIHRVQPIISDLGYPNITERSFNIPMGDLELDGAHTLLIELLAPPRPAGMYRLAHAVLTYDTPGQQLHGDVIRHDIVVQYAVPPFPATVPDPKVMNIVEKVSAHKLQTRALQEAEVGNITGATVKLEAAATRLLNMGENELAQAVLQEAENLKQKGQISAAGTKKLRYETRRLTQKLG